MDHARKLKFSSYVHLPLLPLSDFMTCSERFNVHISALESVGR